MKMSFCLFFCAVTCLYAAEIPVEGGIFKAKLDTRGGALTELQLRGKLLTQKRASMTDRLIANRQNGNSREVPMEFFRDLEYKLISNKTVGAKTDITFQVRGIGAFNWLRMTKTYHFVKNSLRIRVDYQLENLDKQPHYAGIWTQTSLRYCGTGTSPEINTIWQPRGKTVHEFDHPGKGISMDEWLDIKVSDGVIMLSRTFRHKTLEERAAEYGGQLNLDGEGEWREPVGREVW